MGPGQTGTRYGQTARARGDFPSSGASPRARAFPVMPAICRLIQATIRLAIQIAIKAVFGHANPFHANPFHTGRCSGRSPGPPAQTHVVVDILLVYRAIRIDATRRRVRGEVEIAPYDDEPEMLRNQT